MALFKIYKTLAIVAASLLAAASATNAHIFSAIQNATVSRNLGTGSSFVATCYTPFHNKQYPLNGAGVDVNALRQAIDDDFRLLSKHVTHVRTYYSMHYDIEVAPIAAKYGLKLYLGVFLTTESWWATELKAAANAVNNYPGTVEVVLVGNENLQDFRQTSGYILDKVNEIKRAIGANAGSVKWGTVQRINEYVEERYTGEIWNLANNLDILGVNIYPFFSKGFDANRPVDLLDTQWNQAVSRFPRNKFRLTETGFPTAGGSSPAGMYPSLVDSVKYYEGVVDWTPAEYTGLPKFWFQAFDRRADDNTGGVEYERHFGWFNVDRSYKQTNFPYELSTSAQSPSSQSPGSVKLEDGVDYIGNDIGSAPSGGKAEPCFDICRSWGGCRAFTWSTYNGGTCWLKSGKGATQTGVAGGTSSAEIYPPPCKLENGVNYVDNDIGSVPSEKAEPCCDICRKWGGCRAYTWSTYNGGTCWLKSDKGATQIGVAGVTSSVI